MEIWKVAPSAAWEDANKSPRLRSRTLSDATILSSSSEDEEETDHEELDNETADTPVPQENPSCQHKMGPTSQTSCEEPSHQVSRPPPSTSSPAFHNTSDSAMVSLLNRGIRTFNLNPLRGIDFIRKNGLVLYEKGDDEGNARRVAIFLRHTRGLNKEQIGKVLGSENPEHIAILRNYFELFDFSELGPTIHGLECGIRTVFSCFKPPGEAQKIERILDTFADKFNADNNLTSDADQATTSKSTKEPVDIKEEENGEDDKTVEKSKAEFSGSATMVLAFAIILLNVDLHNPKNVQRMSKRQFVSHYKRLDGSNELPEEEMMALYDRILRNEIRNKVDRDEVAGNLFTQPEKCGWLYKKGASALSRWKRRWFILSENALYYFRNSEDVEILGFIPLENVLVRTCFDSRKRPASRQAATGLYSSFTAPPSISNTVANSQSATMLNGRARLTQTMSDFRLRPNHSPDLHHSSKKDSSSVKSFWFELCPWDERLNVKSARMSKSGLNLGQHKTIKLRAQSRQEMESWVENINQNGRFSFHYLAQHRSRDDLGSSSGSTPGSPTTSVSTRSTSSGRFFSSSKNRTSWFTKRKPTSASTQSLCTLQSSSSERMVLDEDDSIHLTAKTPTRELSMT